jgi:hypothetical protein
MCSSETSVDFHMTTRGYIPQDPTINQLPSKDSVVWYESSTLDTIMDLYNQLTYSKYIFLRSDERALCNMQFVKLVILSVTFIWANLGVRVSFPQTFVTSHIHFIRFLTRKSCSSFEELWITPCARLCRRLLLRLSWEIPLLYWTRWFITLFTKARRCSFPWASWIQLTHPRPVS